MIGSTIRKGKVLGEGCFGKVYLCSHESQVFAVKEILKSRTKIEKALMEAEIMKKLNGLDHFVHCYDVFEDRNAIYIVMEYFPDGTLHDLVVTNGIGKGLPDEETCEYFEQLVNGVRQLHALGLMHRDLKPKNILVAKSRKGGNQMKIADFGLATEAQIGSRVYGTLNYMAPEILKGERYDKSVDVYSLGAVLYFMFFGKDPCFDFDACGYPIFPFLQEKLPAGSILPIKHGHIHPMGRFLCKRPEERLLLDQIKFENGSLLMISGTCAVCGKNLFAFTEEDHLALGKRTKRKFFAACGTSVLTAGLASLAFPASPIAVPVATTIVLGSFVVSMVSDLVNLNKYAK